MAKAKYYYDPEKLSFQKIKTKKAKKLGVIILFLVAAALFGFLSFVILLNTNYFETPKDKLLQREIENMRINYAVVNKKVDRLESVLADIKDRDNNVYRAYFNSAPRIDESDDFDAIKRLKSIQKLDNEDLVNNTLERIGYLEKELVAQSKSLDGIVKLAIAKENSLASIPAIQPVKNEQMRHMASGFGYRSDPFTKVRKFHKGMDFSARNGTPVFATGDGVVIRADAGLSGYGNHIEISHGYGYKTLYAHLSKYKATRGRRVKRGDIIGYVGSTGRSEAPHLHYEVYKNGKVVNPLNFYYGSIAAKEYKLIAQLANQENQSLD